MPTLQEVSELVKRFDRNRESYRSSEYNETETRREFIDPFFKALGWDIDNEQGYAEAYKDVVHEDAIKIGGATKAPEQLWPDLKAQPSAHEASDSASRLVEGGKADVDTP